MRRSREPPQTRTGWAMQQHRPTQRPMLSRSKDQMISLPNLQSQFEAKLDDIRGIAAYQFRGLSPEAKDEAVANTLGLCWKYFLRLAEQGKHEDEGVVNSMVYFA